MKFKLKENRKEIITDTLTPVSIYLKIRDIYANSILLEAAIIARKIIAMHTYVLSLLQNLN